MSLTSWLLVLSTHREAETPRAAHVYLVMASFGTACLLLCFGMLGGTGGDYSFAGIRAHSLDAVSASVAALLVLLGRGRRRVWCRCMSGCRWHSRRTQPCFRLMSGVMTKVAIYGLIASCSIWSASRSGGGGAAFLAVVGAVTAVVGVLYALMQDDMKKLLAYSTVENIGVIVIGLGWRWCSRRLACRPWRRSP